MKLFFFDNRHLRWGRKCSYFFIDNRYFGAEAENEAILLSITVTLRERQKNVAILHR
jgi:hypothetical protein